MSSNEVQKRKFHSQSCKEQDLTIIARILTLLNSLGRDECQQIGKKGFHLSWCDIDGIERAIIEWSDATQEFIVRFVTLISEQ